jgi:hypothetical protein
MTFEELRKKTESKILCDIAAFEAILARVHADPPDLEELGRRRVYAALLAARRDMLARLQAVGD